MSREIKFRAWNIVTKTMIDLKKITPLALNIDTDGLFLPFSDGLPLMQYTGLKDKNGKDIYEGDFVKDDLTYLIKFGAYQWDGSDHYGVYLSPTDSDDIDGPFSIEDAKYVQVIGNIYENEELLTPLKTTT